MYQGPAIDLVKRLAVNNEFLAATRNKIPTRRKQDQDFVSRFIAFYLIGYEAYTPDIEKFINLAMAKINRHEIDDGKLEAMYWEFACAMRLARSIFGYDAFRKISGGKRGPINKALFEVVAVTFALLKPEERHRLETKHASELKQALTDALINYDKFSYALSTTTGRPDNVRLRFQTFEKMVRNLLSDDKDA